MTVPFTPVSLEVDDALWGGFWHGDVISPGYTLPAAEAHFLRETRLTESITLPTPADYLAVLQQALTAPLRSDEIVALEEFSARRICAGGWVVWLVNGEIVAGYPNTAPPHPAPLREYARRVMERFPDWQKVWHTLPDAAKIDRLIQHYRARRVATTAD